MFLFHLLFLLFAWGLVQIFENVFPKMNKIAGAESEWLALLLFKPFHLLLSFICFISAFLIVRHIILTHLQILFARGQLFRKSRFASLVVLAAGFGIAGHILMTHFIPTAVLFGLWLGCDLYYWVFRLRRNKRLKSALRALQNDG